MRAEAVKRFLDPNRRKPSYMITQIEVARGAEVISRKWRGYSVGLVVDEITAGVPISVGPQVNLGGNTRDEVFFSL